MTLRFSFLFFNEWITSKLQRSIQRHKSQMHPFFFYLIKSQLLSVEVAVNTFLKLSTYKSCTKVWQVRNETPQHQLKNIPIGGLRENTRVINEKQTIKHIVG